MCQEEIYDILMISFASEVPVNLTKVLEIQTVLLTHRTLLDQKAPKSSKHWFEYYINYVLFLPVMAYFVIENHFSFLGRQFICYFFFWCWMSVRPRDLKDKHTAIT